jgi:hypothetical protein
MVVPSNKSLQRTLGNVAKIHTDVVLVPRGKAPAIVVERR